MDTATENRVSQLLDTGLDCPAVARSKNLISECKWPVAGHQSPGVGSVVPRWSVSPLP